MRLAPALSADNVKIDDLVAASTISEMQRDANVKAARAFYAEVAVRSTLSPRRRTRSGWIVAPHNWFMNIWVQQAARAVRKGVDMIPLKTISEKLNTWRRHREAVRELSQF